MRFAARSFIRRYAIVPLVVLCALALRLLLWPVLGPQVPFLFLWPAVMITAWYGGLGPGITATFVSVFAAEFLLLDQRHSLLAGRPETVVAAALFVVLGCIVSSLTARLRHAREEVAQKALEAARQKESLRVTLASIADAVIATDVHARITFMNAAAQSLTGWKQDEVTGQPLGQILPLADERTGLPLPDPAEDVLRRGVVLHLVERPVLRTRGGAHLPVAASAAPMRDTAGDVCGMVVALQNASRERSTLNELRRRAEDLTQAGNRKNEFIALLAHELRNPLSPIRNAAQMLRQGGIAESHVRWAAGVIERQVDLISRLVEDLLDVARVQRAKIKLQQERIELADAINSAVEVSRPLIAAHRHELNLSFPAEPVHLLADRFRLIQVFANLLNNAAKYTPDGGRIDVSAHVRHGEAIVAIRDNGAGIAAEMLPHIFDLFMQDERALPRAEGGLGLGLTLARGLVELHAGRLEAFSDGPGLGSEFVVHLPLPANPSADAVTRETSQPRRHAEVHGS